MADELHSRLLEDAARYDPVQHTRSLLRPFRDVLLLQRAKFMSYEQIAATLTLHGLKISAAAVGCFCRRQFSRAEIEAKRRELDRATPPPPQLKPNSRPEPLPTAPSAPRRGPRVARDNY